MQILRNRLITSTGNQLLFIHKGAKILDFKHEDGTLFMYTVEEEGESLELIELLYFHTGDNISPDILCDSSYKGTAVQGKEEAVHIFMRYKG